MSKFVHYEYESENICKEYMTLINKFLNNRKECFFKKEDIKDSSKFIVITDTNFGDVVLNDDGLEEFMKSLSGFNNLFYPSQLIDKYDRISIEEFMLNKERYEQEIKEDGLCESHLETYYISQALAKSVLDTEYFNMDLFRNDKRARDYLRNIFSYVDDAVYEGDYLRCEDFELFLQEKDNEDYLNEIKGLEGAK